MNQADLRVNLAADRTRLAYERTMTAWARTLLMILIGLTTLLIAARDNRRDWNNLKDRYPNVKLSWSRARMFSTLIAILGFVALAGVILRK